MDWGRHKRLGEDTPRQTTWTNQRATPCHTTSCSAMQRKRRAPRGNWAIFNSGTVWALIYPWGWGGIAFAPPLSCFLSQLGVEETWECSCVVLGCLLGLTNTDNSSVTPLLQRNLQTCFESRQTERLGQAYVFTQRMREWSNYLHNSNPHVED